MADLDVRSLRVLDGPGPQHKVAGKEALEFSEGSNGAFHTKVTDVNGNPIDPREVNNDSVVNELQTMKADIAETKQQNADILAKLNGVLDTQVTGSYVEYRILSTDPEPEAKADEKGAQLIVMDTGDIKMNHGGTWGEF